MKVIRNKKRNKQNLNERKNDSDGKMKVTRNEKEVNSIRREKGKEIKVQESKMKII